MKLTATMSRRWMVSLSLLLAAGAIALAPRSLPWHLVTAPAQAQLTHPFAGHSIVYVQTGDRWREAFITGVSGQSARGQTTWAYSVEYVDATGGREQGISPDRLATIATAQAQGLTDNVYDVSTPAGIEQMLAAHNAVRRTVGVSDLAWSAELATLAQAWAEVLLQSGPMRHRPASERDQGRIGENIASSQASGAGGALRHPQRAVKGWVDERADYDYATNTCTPGQVCGHYTQMVWADTDAVGCGVARNADQTREVWVCNYSPAGNFVGERPY